MRSAVMLTMLALVLVLCVAPGAGDRRRADGAPPRPQQQHHHDQRNDHHDRRNHHDQRNQHHHHREEQHNGSDGAADVDRHHHQHQHQHRFVDLADADGSHWRHGHNDHHDRSHGHDHGDGNDHGNDHGDGRQSQPAAHGPRSEHGDNNNKNGKKSGNKDWKKNGGKDGKKTWEKSTDNGRGGDVDNDDHHHEDGLRQRNRQGEQHHHHEQHQQEHQSRGDATPRKKTKNTNKPARPGPTEERAEERPAGEGRTRLTSVPNAADATPAASRLSPAAESLAAAMAAGAEDVDVAAEDDGAEPLPPPHQDVAAMARYIVHVSDWAAMATISTREPTRGMPFANVFSVCDGTRYRSTGIPYLYLTDMEISVQDLRVNNSASLTMSLAQTEFCRRRGYDPEDPLCAHVILSGRVLQVDEADAEYTFARDALFARHPEMSGWPAGHHFFVAKLDIQNIIVLDYFGGAKTVAVKEYFGTNPFSVNPRRVNEV